MSFNVAAKLQGQARIRPDRPALIMAAGRDADGPRWATLTFAELDRLSDRYAAGLKARGVRRGDRTLFLMKPSPDFYAVLFGVIKLGALPESTA